MIITRGISESIIITLIWVCKSSFFVEVVDISTKQKTDQKTKNYGNVGTWYIEKEN